MNLDKYLSLKTIFGLDIDSLPVPVMFDHIRPASEQLDLSNGRGRGGGIEVLIDEITRDLVCQCHPKVGERHWDHP